MSKSYSTECQLQNSFDDMIAICSLSKCNTFKESRFFFNNWVYIAIYHLYYYTYIRCRQRVYRCDLRRIKQNGAQAKWLVEHSRTCTSVHPYYVDYRQTLFAVFMLSLSFYSTSQYTPSCVFFSSLISLGDLSHERYWIGVKREQHEKVIEMQACAVWTWRHHVTVMIESGCSGCVRMGAQQSGRFLGGGLVSLNKVVGKVWNVLYIISYRERQRQTNESQHKKVRVLMKRAHTCALSVHADGGV